MEAFFVELKENVEAIVFIHDFEEEYFLHYDKKGYFVMELLHVLLVHSLVIYMPYIL